jgi:hypothetical protein
VGAGAGLAAETGRGDATSKVVPFNTGANPFEVVFAPAQQVLDAVLEMRKPLMWLNQQRRSGRPLFNPDGVVELIELIPDGGRLASAGALFLEAEEQPAPEGWLHVTLGVMLDSEPSVVNVPNAFRCAIADSLYRDPEVWGDYEPGVSQPQSSLGRSGRRAYKARSRRAVSSNSA